MASAGSVMEDSDPSSKITMYKYTRLPSPYDEKGDNEPNFDENNPDLFFWVVILGMTLEEVKHTRNEDVAHLFDNVCPGNSLPIRLAVISFENDTDEAETVNIGNYMNVEVFPFSKELRFDPDAGEISLKTISELVFPKKTFKCFDVVISDWSSPSVCVGMLTLSLVRPYLKVGGSVYYNILPYLPKRDMRDPVPRSWPGGQYYFTNMNDFLMSRKIVNGKHPGLVELVPKSPLSRTSAGGRAPAFLDRAID